MATSAPDFWNQQYERLTGLYQRRMDYEQKLVDDHRAAMEKQERERQKAMEDAQPSGFARALPALGTIGGTALGALLALPTGGLSVPVGASLGAGLGAAAGGVASSIASPNASAYIAPAQALAQGVANTGLRYDDKMMSDEARATQKAATDEANRRHDDWMDFMRSRYAPPVQPQTQVAPQLAPLPGSPNAGIGPMPGSPYGTMTSQYPLNPDPFNFYRPTY